MRWLGLILCLWWLPSLCGCGPADSLAPDAAAVDAGGKAELPGVDLPGGTDLPAEVQYEAVGPRQICVPGETKCEFEAEWECNEEGSLWVLVKQCGGQGACVDGECVCEPDCGGLWCGPDGCGGSCGECGADEVCNSIGHCEPGFCVPDCEGRECGSNGCDYGDCGECGPCLQCAGDGTCEPVPAGDDPYDDCEEDSEESCGLDGECDGDGG